MNKECILPLGAIVRLIDGTQPILIMGRGQLCEVNGTTGYFDYCAVPYPQGVLAKDQFAFFNDEDIAEVVFEGYRNEEEIAFAEAYKENISKVPYPKLKVTSNG